jgi:hypothetical protein
VQGTYRKDRHGPVAAAPVEKVLPKPPPHLHERAAELFNELVGLCDGRGMDIGPYAHMLAMAATSLWEWERHEDVLESLGWTYTTVNMAGSTMYRPRPESAFRDRAMKRAESLLSRFGLSPADVGRVAANPPADENPFAAIG